MGQLEVPCEGSEGEGSGGAGSGRVKTPETTQESAESWLFNVPLSSRSKEQEMRL